MTSIITLYWLAFFFFFSSRRRHTRFDCDWSSDVCSSDLFFYQTPGLVANDPVNKSSIPLLPREQFVQKIPGFSLGGPIRKDKTFVFTNLQVLRTLRTVHVSSTVLTASALKGIFRYVTGGNCGTPCRNRPAGSSGASVDASGNGLAGGNVSSYDIAVNDPARAGLDPAIQSLITKSPLPRRFP